jgi:hypothetical protein
MTSRMDEISALSGGSGLCISQTLTSRQAKDMVWLPTLPASFTQRPNNTPGDCEIRLFEGAGCSGRDVGYVEHVNIERRTPLN